MAKDMLDAIADGGPLDTESEDEEMDASESDPFAMAAKDLGFEGVKADALKRAIQACMDERDYDVELDTELEE